MREFREPTASQSRFAASRRQTSLADGEGVVDLAEVQASEVPRILTGIGEFDRVTGGGLVPGGVGLIGGDPGIGKSTLLLQVLARMVRLGKTALYVSGEESASQVALRAQRIGLDPSGMRLMSEIELERIEAEISASKPQFVVIDSIQTLYSSDLESAPGSVTQVRECSARLTRLAKTTGAALIFVGHVTKDGALAGPRVLEHIVDTVLYFEGDTHSNFRLIRAFKNRFGAVNELGVFAMTDRGLRAVSNPSAIFLSEHRNRCGRKRRHGDPGGFTPSAGGNPGSGPTNPIRLHRDVCASVWTRSVWLCFWRCCIATPAFPALKRTCL